MKKFLFVLLFVTLSSPSFGQGIKDIAKRNDANAPGGAAAQVAVGQEAEGLLANLNEKILADFKDALVLAETKDAKGNQADPISAPCLAAVIPVLELISKNAPADSDGLVTKVVKIRILRLRLQSQDLQIACAPWKEDEKSLVRKGVLGLLFGAMKFGLL